MRRLWTLALMALPLLGWAAPAQAASGAPPGWSGAGKWPQDYDFGTDAKAGTAGKQAAYVKAKPDARGDGFGTLTQCIRADKFIGQRLRFGARLQSVDALRVQLWMRVDGPEGKVLSFYNMVDRPLIGTTGWQQENVVLDVPTGSRVLCYGFFLAGGQGEAWADGLNIAPVTRDVPVSQMPAPNTAPTAPVNLGFDR